MFMLDNQVYSARHPRTMVKSQAGDDRGRHLRQGRQNAFPGIGWI
jgi:hypothetical protein